MTREGPRGVSALLHSVIGSILRCALDEQNLLRFASEAVSTALRRGGYANRSPDRHTNQRLGRRVDLVRQPLLLWLSPALLLALPP